MNTENLTQAKTAVKRAPRIVVYLRARCGDTRLEARQLRRQARECMRIVRRRFGRRGYQLSVLQDAGYASALSLGTDAGCDGGDCPPGLRGLLGAAEAGEVDVVVTATLDRICRSVLAWAKHGQDLFTRRGLTLITRDGVLSGSAATAALA